MECVPFRGSSRVQIQLFNALHERSLASDCLHLSFLRQKLPKVKDLEELPRVRPTTCAWKLNDVDRLMIASMCHYRRICLGALLQEVSLFRDTVAVSATSTVRLVAAAFADADAKYYMQLTQLYYVQLNFTLQDLLLRLKSPKRCMIAARRIRVSFLPSYRETASLYRIRIRFRAEPRGRLGQAAQPSSPNLCRKRKAIMKAPFTHKSPVIMKAIIMSKEYDAGAPWL